MWLSGYVAMWLSGHPTPKNQKLRNPNQKPRNQETKKPRNQETKKPTTKKPTTKKPRNWGTKKATNQQSRNKETKRPRNQKTKSKNRKPINLKSFFIYKSGNPQHPSTYRLPPLHPTTFLGDTAKRGTKWWRKWQGLLPSKSWESQVSKHEACDDSPTLELDLSLRRPAGWLPRA